MVIYGKNSVLEALRGDVVLKKIFIRSENRKKYTIFIETAKSKNIPISFIKEKEMEEISGSQKHQGVCAIIELPENIIEKEEDFKTLDGIKNVLVLDGITDTGNLGAIIRSAVLLNCDLVILPEDNSARITPQTIKTSAGAIFKQKVLFVHNLRKWLEMLKENNYTIIGLCKEGTKKINEINGYEKLVCIIGSEDKGIRKSIRKKCDIIASIPTTEKIDSLNASVAAAITMWELFANS